MSQGGIESTVEVRGIHIGLHHWTQEQLVRWLRAPIAPPLHVWPWELAPAMREAEAYHWQIVGLPTHRTAKDGSTVATYRLRATRREAQP
jgi:hypothetical protein